MSEPIVAGFEHVDVCAMLGGTPWLCRLHDRAHVTLGPSKSAGLRYQCNWRPLRIQDIIHCMTRPAFDVSQLTPDEKLDLKAAPIWQPGSGWVSQGELGRRMRPVLASRWVLDHLNSLNWNQSMATNCPRVNFRAHHRPCQDYGNCASSGRTCAHKYGIM